MKVYHYSCLENWPKIKRGSWKSNYEPGLGASRRMGRKYIEALTTGAVFALLEPLPDDWVNNRFFPETWDYLRHDLGILLLELDVDPAKDPVFVVDRGHIEGVLYEQKEGIPKRYLHPSRKEGEQAYMESKIPLQDYLERAGDLRYSMPEVVITENVPLKKIRVSDQQPLIENELRMYSGELRQMLIKDINKIAELSSWYKQYEQREYERELREGRIGSFGEKLK